MINKKRCNAVHCAVVLAILLPMAFFYSLDSGPIELDLFNSISRHLRGSSDQSTLILIDIRVPRALLSVLVGAVLAACGAVMQGLFRNPLADPSLIGVTAGASLGASLAIVLGGSVASTLLGFTLTSLGAFIGGLISVMIVYSLSRTGAVISVAAMLLSGIAISALAGSIGSLFEYFADNEMLRRISLWRMGGLDGATYKKLCVASVIAAFVLSLLPRFASALNALLLGESEARHLGIDVDRIKWHLILLVAVGVGTSVALAGTITFVGLVVPHIMRMLIGPDHRVLILASMLAGAILLLTADTLARTAIPPEELPVGVITALIGVPFFISLLRRRHHYGMQ